MSARYSSGYISSLSSPRVAHEGVYSPSSHLVLCCRLFSHLHRITQAVTGTIPPLPRRSVSIATSLALPTSAPSPPPPPP